MKGNTPIVTLLVTNSALTAEAIRIMLQTFPAIQFIGQIQDSRSARAMVKEWHPDLVFLDFRLSQSEIEKTIGMIQEESQETITVAIIENQSHRLAAARARVTGILTPHFTFDELQFIMNKYYACVAV